jgi:hypothetical protein
MQDWLNALWDILVHFWPAVLGVGVPFVAGAIAECNWSKTAKTYAAFGVSIFVGILGTFVAGLAFAPVTLLAFIVSVFTIAQLAYPVMKDKIGFTAAWLDALLAWHWGK